MAELKVWQKVQEAVAYSFKFLYKIMKAKNETEEKEFYSFKPDLEEKVLEVTRVTTVLKGGKLISFRAIVAVGNRKGIVGIGIGRASDFGSAVKKAATNGKKNAVSIFLTKSLSIPRILCEKFSASKVILIPAKPGVGILSGGAPKVILEMAGVTNVICKQLGSPNILNNARATLNGLLNFKEKSNILKALNKKKIGPKCLKPL